MAHIWYLKPRPDEEKSEDKEKRTNSRALRYSNIKRGEKEKEEPTKGTEMEQ